MGVHGDLILTGGARKGPRTSKVRGYEGERLQEHESNDVKITSLGSQSGGLPHVLILASMPAWTLVHCAAFRVYQQTCSSISLAIGQYFLIPVCTSALAG